MRKFLLFVSFIGVVLLFNSCSSKKVFEPKKVDGDWELGGDIKHSIVDTTGSVALLENGMVLTKERLIKVIVPKEHRLLGISGDWVLSSSIDGDLVLQSISNHKLIERLNLKKTIATASVKDDIIAVLFADNEMALYSLSTKEPLAIIQGGRAITADVRIVQPHFMNDLVLFLTLNGKITIVNTKTKKRLRNIIVSSKDNFNNIIYFNIVDSKLIAATGSEVLSFGQKEIRADYDIRNILDVNNTIYLTTRQGEVIALSPNLEFLAKVKFPFAHFLGLVYNDGKLYTIEKEGYIIELSKDLHQYKIYEADIDEDGYIFSGNKRFYINDEYISVVK